MDNAMNGEYDDLIPEALRCNPAPAVGAGRVLRVRLGYNPNSSSVGTTVVVFLWSMVGSATVLAATASLLAWRLGGGGDGAQAEPASPSESEE